MCSQGFIFPVHGYGFLRSLNEIAVAIEQSRDASQDIVVSAFDFAKVQVLYVHVGEDDKFGILVAGFEKLRVQFDGKIVQFLLGEHLIFDFLLGLLVGVGEMSWARNSRGGPAGVSFCGFFSVTFRL